MSVWLIRFKVRVPPLPQSAHSTVETTEPASVREGSFVFLAANFTSLLKIWLILPRLFANSDMVRVPFRSCGEFRVPLGRESDKGKHLVSAPSPMVL